VSWVAVLELLKLHVLRRVTSVVDVGRWNEQLSHAISTSPHPAVDMHGRDLWRPVSLWPPREAPCGGLSRRACRDSTARRAPPLGVSLRSERSSSERGRYGHHDCPPRDHCVTRCV